jgi:radical SAM superfamily enzyme
LIAPRWDKSRQEILRDIERRLELRDTFQGKKMKIHAGIK